MPRLVRDTAFSPAGVDVRRVLLERFRRQAARCAVIEGAVYGDDRSAAWADALEAGEPVVLPAMYLHRFRLPQVRRGVHGYYRITAGGDVEPVGPVRDPLDPMSITGWEPAEDRRPLPTQNRRNKQ